MATAAIVIKMVMPSILTLREFIISSKRLSGVPQHRMSNVKSQKLNRELANFHFWNIAGVENRNQGKR
jgi:hypothetical protein